MVRQQCAAKRVAAARTARHRSLVGRRTAALGRTLPVVMRAAGLGT
jgi:hypothetical protein